MGHRLIQANCRHKAWGRGLYTQLLCSVLVLLLCLPAPIAHAFWEFTVKDEAELGKKFNILVKSQLPLVQDPEITAYIDDLVARLAKTMPPQPFPFTASVVRHNAINAFATPGGYVFVFTGLILAMNHEAELAGVLAHEMAHVTQRHIASRIQKGRMVSILSIVGALAGAFMGGEGGSAAMAGSMAAGQAAMLSYSRTDENEADQVGMNYLTKAGFNPQGMGGAFKVLGRKQIMMGSKIPSYYSTHPDINQRADDMAQRVARLPEAQRKKPDNDARFMRIQTLVRGRYSDPDTAERAFAKQLEKGPNALALMGQGILWSRLNRINDATAAFAKAMELAPKDELIIREAGRFHYTKGNRDQGVALLRRAVDMDSKDIMARYYLARVQGDEGKLNEAIENTRLVLRVVPEDVELHEMLARLHGQNNQMFLAYLHMAYAALYSNNKTKTAQLYEKLNGMPRQAEEKNQLERFHTSYKERREFW